MYCSATRSCTASKPPGSLIASATRRMPSAVAVATAMIAAACPSASLICCCLRASDALMTSCFAPSAVLIAASRAAFGRQNHRALLALGAHLLLHRRQNVVRRRDVLDLVAQHLHAPRLRRLVELADDLRVDVGPLLERLVQIDLADLAAQRRLRELADREHVVGDAVRRALRIQHLQVEDAVDADLHVVARDADLRRDVDGDLLERVAVADDIDERQQHVKARAQRAVKPAEALDDVRALLRHDDRRLRDDDEHEQGEDEETTRRPPVMSALLLA